MKTVRRALLISVILILLVISYAALMLCGLGQGVGLKFSLNEDGKSYSVTDAGLLIGEVEIPSTYNGLPVTRIGDDAFRLVLVIPKSIQSIVRIFDNITIRLGLTGVVIPDSVTTIDYRAFSYCVSLKNVEIPDSVTEIGDLAFSYCTNLKNIEIPDSVTEIGDWAFINCKSLKSIEIPDSVTEIGSGAFENCKSLTSVTINGTPYIGRDTFSKCNSALYTEYEFGIYIGDTDNPYAILYKLTDKNLPTYTINENTNVIYHEVFYGCENLTTIEIPNSVTTIGHYAFYNCNSLTSISIPDSVTTIGGSAFAKCTSLASVSFGDSLTKIGDRTFDHCISLTSVVIPDNITAIGFSAFDYCTGIVSVVIPDSVTVIGDHAFYFCYSLASIKYCGTVGEWNAITKGYNWDYCNGNYTITYNYDVE